MLNSLSYLGLCLETLLAVKSLLPPFLFPQLLSKRIGGPDTRSLPSTSSSSGLLRGIERQPTTLILSKPSVYSLVVGFVRWRTFTSLFGICATNQICFIEMTKYKLLPEKLIVCCTGACFYWMNVGFICSFFWLSPIQPLYKLLMSDPFTELPSGWQMFSIIRHFFFLPFYQAGIA